MKGCGEAVPPHKKHIGPIDPDASTLNQFLNVFGSSRDCERSRGRRRSVVKIHAHCGRPMHRPNQERQLPIAGRAAKSVTQDLGSGVTRHRSCSGRMRGRIAACTEASGLPNPPLCRPRSSKPPTGWQRWRCVRTAKPLVISVVKTGGNAALLNRR